jgi:hypothetical protein
MAKSFRLMPLLRTEKTFQDTLINFETVHFKNKIIRAVAATEETLPFEFLTLTLKSKAALET